MCVILTCEPNCRPTSETLETCWLHNPDGAGLAWSDGYTVHASKGYMTFTDLTEMLRAVPADAPLLLHFRIGTSGGYDARVTHPYPLTDDLRALHALDYDAPIVVAHNGVLPLATDEKRGISDTITFVRSYLQGIKRCSDLRRGTLLRASRGSRLAFLDASGAFCRIGAGWEGAGDGICASNGSWRPRAYDAWPEKCFVGDYDEATDELLALGCYGCDCIDECAAYGPLCHDYDCWEVV